MRAFTRDSTKLSAMQAWHILRNNLLSILLEGNGTGFMPPVESKRGENTMSLKTSHSNNKAWCFLMPHVTQISNRMCTTMFLHRVWYHLLLHGHCDHISMESIARQYTSHWHCMLVASISPISEQLNENRWCKSYNITSMYISLDTSFHDAHMWFGLKDLQRIGIVLPVGTFAHLRMYIPSMRPWWLAWTKHWKSWY